jgi:hypothetical protein
MTDIHTRCEHPDPPDATVEPAHRPPAGAGLLLQDEIQLLPFERRSTNDDRDLREQLEARMRAVFA